MNRLFDKYLEINLKDIVDLKLKKDYDWFQILTGREGYGKSTLGIQMCSFVDPSFNVNRICLDIDEFIKALKDSKKYQAIMLDEAGTNLYSREAMSNMNRLLTKAFMVIRSKNIFLCLVLPSFFLLDTYIRNHRVNSLINITKRGKFDMYSYRQTKIVSISGMKYKEYNVVRPSISGGYFTKQFPNKELEEQYLKKKENYVNKFLRDMQRDREGFYTIRKFAEITGYSIRTIKRWLEDKKIKFKKIGGRNYIPKTEADNIGDREVGEVVEGDEGDNV